MKRNSSAVLGPLRLSPGRETIHEKPNAQAFENAELDPRDGRLIRPSRGSRGPTFTLSSPDDERCSAQRHGAPEAGITGRKVPARDRDQDRAGLACKPGHLPLPD